MGGKKVGWGREKRKFSAEPEGPQVLVAQEDGRRCSFLFKTPSLIQGICLPRDYFFRSANIHACCWEVLLPAILVSAGACKERRQNLLWPGKWEPGADGSLAHTDQTQLKGSQMDCFSMKKFTDNCEINGYCQIGISVFAGLAPNVMFKYRNLHEIPRWR